MGTMLAVKGNGTTTGARCLTVMRIFPMRTGRLRKTWGSHPVGAAGTTAPCWAQPPAGDLRVRLQYVTTISWHVSVRVAKTASSHARTTTTNNPVAQEVRGCCIDVVRQ